MNSQNGAIIITEEQRKRAERSRQKALEIRAQRQQQQAVAASQPSTSSSSSSFTNNRSLISPAVAGQAPGTSRQSNVAVPSKLPLNSVAKITISCSLVTRTRFSVQSSSFDETLQNICKSLPSRIYDPRNRTWNFLLGDYDKFAQITAERIPLAKLSGLPIVVRKTLPKAFRGCYDSQRYDNICLSLLEPTLERSLFPFQRDGIRYIVSKGGRALLADDMGLGKTVQALGVASYYRDDWPLLIVCPSSMRFIWAEAVKRWLPSVREETVKVLTSTRDQIPSPEAGELIIILSYDLLSAYKGRLINTGFKFIVLDESHLVKNYKAQRTKTATDLARNVRRVLLLTGTPALSRPSELYSQIDIVKPGLIGFKNFAFRYCEGREGPFGLEANGASNMGELRVIMEEVLMIRRLKSDVLRQLPDKRREMVVLDKTSVKTEMKNLQKLRKEMENETLSLKEREGALLRFFHESALAKMDAVKKYILDLLEGERKLLVFAHHQVVLDALTTALTVQNIDHIRIDGSTPSNQRAALVEEFQTVGSCRVACLSITAANTGLTLTAASLVVFAELFWNPGVLVQAEDRAHRVGQQDSVVVRYLVATGTADDYLWPAVQSKLDVLNQIGLSKDNFRHADTTVLRDTPGDPKPKTLARRPKGCQSILNFVETLVQQSLEEGNSGEKASSVDGNCCTTNVGKISEMEAASPSPKKLKL